MLAVNTGVTLRAADVVKRAHFDRCNKHQDEDHFSLAAKDFCMYCIHLTRRQGDKLKNRVWKMQADCELRGRHLLSRKAQREINEGEMSVRESTALLRPRVRGR